MCDVLRKTEMHYLYVKYLTNKQMKRTTKSALIQSNQTNMIHWLNVIENRKSVLGKLFFEWIKKNIKQDTQSDLFLTLFNVFPGTSWTDSVSGWM